MKRITLGIIALLATGSIGIANATPVNLVTNGDFSQTTGPATPWQFGTSNLNSFQAQQIVTGWTGNNGYNIWYDNASDAVNVQAHSTWGTGGANTGLEKLWAVTANPNFTSFVGLDGEQTSGVQGSIGQTLDNLTAGASYTVSFWWGASQMQSRNGDTTEQVAVSFGNDTKTTTVNDNPSHSFSGWWQQSFTFVAGSSSEFLNFLSIGTPAGYPPMVLLGGVSVTQNVPEPPALAMFGGGLLGLGLLTVFARRRALREKHDLA
jgi:hypothetical protein